MTCPLMWIVQPIDSYKEWMGNLHITLLALGSTGVVSPRGLDRI